MGKEAKIGGGVGEWRPQDTSTIRAVLRVCSPSIGALPSQSFSPQSTAVHFIHSFWGLWLDLKM